jgi:PAS domain-containing protein
MFPFITLADEVLQSAVSAVRRGGRAERLALDAFPAAFYVTDLDGFISYFNPACVGLADGRRYQDQARRPRGDRNSRASRRRSH